MRRISTDTSVNGKFVNGDSETGVKSTKLNAEWFNSIQEEVAHAIEDSGRSLDPNDDHQLSGVIVAEFFRAYGPDAKIQIKKSNATILVAASVGGQGYDGKLKTLEISQPEGTVTIVNTQDIGITLKYADNVGNVPNATRSVAAGEVLLVSSYNIMGSRFVQFQTLSYSGSNDFDSINVKNGATIGGDVTAGGNVKGAHAFFEDDVVKTGSDTDGTFLGVTTNGGGTKIYTNKVVTNGNVEASGQIKVSGERGGSVMDSASVSSPELIAGSKGISSQGEISTDSNINVGGGATINGMVTIGNSKAPLMKINSSEVIVNGDMSTQNLYPNTIFLDNLSASPSNSGAGGLCCVNGELYFYSGIYQRWLKVTVTG